MIGSLYSGISGLKANTSAMAVIGDNIANVETTGFKASKVAFANVFNATLGQSRLQIGRGVTMSGTSSNWNAGTLQNTENVTDLAINGKGMFIVRDPNDNAQYYTRAGKFEFDRNRRLVTPDGLVVQGYALSSSGALGTFGNITLPSGMNQPQATDTLTMNLNLDASASTGDTYDTTVTVYDSLGNAVDLTFNFTKTSSGWEWYVTSSDGSATPSSSSPYTLAFTSSGALDPASCTPASSNPTIAVTGLSGANLSITWEYLDGTATDGSITGYAGDSVKTAQTQNGYPTGMLQGVAVDDDGVFTALYSNGTMLPFARVALADFANYSGLAKQGSNLYTSSLSSGQAVISPPNTAGVGGIAANALEMSNVDLASEFVDLITTQRAFQANSKVITTSDEVLADLINIKR